MRLQQAQRSRRSRERGERRSQVNLSSLRSSNPLQRSGKARSGTGRRNGGGIKFGEEKRSKMKSYGGRKKEKNPRKKDEEEGRRRQEEELQKAAEALEKREDRINLRLRSPNAEKPLSLGQTERNYGGSRPRRLVSQPVQAAPASRDQQGRIDCSPGREEEVTVRPAITDLGRRRRTPARKCKQTPAGTEDCFSWRGEKIGLGEIREMEAFYQDLASSDLSPEEVFNGEPKNSPISREKNFFFEVYKKMMMIHETMGNVSEATLMTLLSANHLGNEDFKQMILKEKESEKVAPPAPVSTAGVGQPPAAVSTAGVGQPPAAVSEEQLEPLDLSLPTRERAREGLEPGLASPQSGGLEKIKKEPTEEEGEKNQGKKLKGELKNRRKKKIKEKPTRKIQLADKKEVSIRTSTATSNSSKKDEEIVKSVFLSMEEKSQEVRYL